MKTKSYKKLGYLGVMTSLIIGYGLVTDSGCANAGAALHNTACEADFRTQMVNRATIMAERHSVIAETLINKPDSVLEYSCFDQNAALLAVENGPLFSESTAWNSDSVTISGGFGDTALVNVANISYSVNMGNTRLDQKINNLVFETINDYVSDSFSHDFLGGKMSGSDNNIGNNVAGVNSSCDHMQSIYEVARCEDFATDRPFGPLAKLDGTSGGEWVDDPRANPASCGTAHMITTALIEQANNKDFTHTGFDQVDDYNEYFAHDTAGFGSDCSLTPIPTGVMIQYVEITMDSSGDTNIPNDYEYEDKVCPSPGCYFDHGGDANGSNDKCVN